MKRFYLAGLNPDSFNKTHRHVLVFMAAEIRVLQILCKSPTTRGQKKKVSVLSSLNRYHISMNMVIRNSKAAAALYFRCRTAVKHTNATKKVA